MDCREIDQFLMDYLDGRLSLRRRQLFDEHVSECPDCVAYLETYRRTIRIGKAAFADPSADASKIVPRRILQAIRQACQLE